MSNRALVLMTVIVGIALLSACGPVTPFPPTATATPPPTQTPTVTPRTTGTLVVEIIYSGEWYRETFDYKPDAPNIRHAVLVMPVDGIIQLRAPGWAFSNLQFSPSPEPLKMRTEAVEMIPILDFMYDAPGGVAFIELEPGKYNVAVAFIAAALPPPGGDVILYPGITGGGASSDFVVVEIAAGMTVFHSVELTDTNGWGYQPRLAMR